MTILIIDDDIAFIELTRRILTKKMPEPPQIMAATTCQAGIGIIRSDRSVDCILMDQRLTGMDTGVECIQEIRGIAYPGAIVLLTGYLDDHIATEAVRAGADEFLAKDQGMLADLVPAITHAIRFRHAFLEIQDRTLHEQMELADVRRKLQEAMARIDLLMRDSMKGS